jgi:riboflavin biosynthesis pyrimidine reductase
VRLELLWEAQDLAAFELPDELAERYGGPLGFPERCVYTNFVSTVDGTVAIADLEQSTGLIGDKAESDRFVMGILRACADAVLIGAGTLRASPKATWQPHRVHKASTDAFAELRRRLEKPEHVEVAVVTASGDIDPEHPVLENGGVVLTSDRGAERLEGRVPDAATVVPLGGGTTVDPQAVIDALHARGHERILSEAGPTLFGALVGAGLVDELFLSVSPFLAGGERSGSRLSLAEGMSLLPTQRVRQELLSVRREDDFLFLRYKLGDVEEGEP